MLYYKILPALTLGLISIYPINAQQTDSLKRQLYVLTDQQEETTEKTPLPFEIKLPLKSKKTKMLLTPIPIKPFAPSIYINPLDNLNKPKPFYSDKKQKAYINLGLGLFYSANLDGAWRLSDEVKQTWDIYFDALYFQHKLLTNKIEQSIKTEQLNLISTYKRNLNDDLLLEINTGYERGIYNYYAYINSQKEGGNSPKLNQNGVSLDLLLSNINKSRLINYTVVPHFSFVSTDGLFRLISNTSIREFEFGLNAQFNYNYSEEKSKQIGLNLRLDSYTQNKEILSLVHLRPYWKALVLPQLAVNLGVNLDMYRQREDKGLLPSIYLDVMAQAHRRCSVKFHLNGEVKANRLSKVLKRMPYLDLDVPLWITSIPIDAQLKITTLLQSNLAFNLLASYIQYRNEFNFLFLEPWNIYKATQTNSQVMSLGLNLNYRPTKVMTLSLAGRYNKYMPNSSHDLSLYGRPKLELLLKGNYRPQKNLEFLGGIDIKTGIKQKIDNTISNRSFISSLPALTVIHLGVNYQITKRWSFGASTYAYSDSKATPYYGYLPQRVGLKSEFCYKL